MPSEIGQGKYKDFTQFMILFYNSVPGSIDKYSSPPQGYLTADDPMESRNLSDTARLEAMLIITIIALIFYVYGDRTTVGANLNKNMLKWHMAAT